MSGNILSLLGLALRGRRLAVGDEPAALAARAGEARLLLLASDAAENTLRRGARLAEEGHCLHLILPFTKAELGGALGRGSAAVAAVTDLGLAAAVVRKLAVLDPERYGGAAARMEQKLRRAEERRAAPPREKRGQRPPEGKRRERSGGPARSGEKHGDPSGQRRPGGKPGERPPGGTARFDRERGGEQRAGRRSGGPPRQRRETPRKSSRFQGNNRDHGRGSSSGRGNAAGGGR